MFLNKPKDLKPITLQTWKRFSPWFYYKKIKALLAIISNLCIPNAPPDLLDVKYLSEKMSFKYI